MGTCKVILRVVEGPHVGREFAFAEHKTFVVGRAEGADFRLEQKDKLLSRNHFLVEVNPPLCRVMDLANTNGIRVNGRKVFVADLKPGDTIQGGNTVMEVSIVGAPAGVPDTTLTAAARALPAAGRGAPVACDEHGYPVALPGYRIERPLVDKPGMGHVVLAATERDGRPVVLKMIRPAVAGDDVTVARFLREASLLRGLRHENIVRFLDVGFASGTLFFAIEYVPRVTSAGSSNCGRGRSRRGGRSP